MEFTANIKDLKKAFSITSLAVSEGSENINTHALFDIKEGVAFLYATDNNRLSVAHLPVNDLVCNDCTQFTVNSKKIQKLLSGSDSENIKFLYDKNTKTLNIYASEISDAYVSFASFNPEDFLSFDKDLSTATELKVLNADMFLAGIKFIQGFLPNNDVNKRYSNLFIVDGAMKGSTGTFKIGAFESDDLKGLSLTIQRTMIPFIESLIDISKASDIIISETSRLIIVSTKDQLYRFAFRKSTIPVPLLPIELKVPQSDSIKVERNVLIKKLNRLALTSSDEFGVKFKSDGTELSMETTLDRKSYEKMSITGGSIEFILDCIKFRDILSTFISKTIDIYVDKTKCTFYCSGSLIIEETGKSPITIPYTTVGIQTLAMVLNG